MAIMIVFNYSKSPRCYAAFVDGSVKCYNKATSKKETFMSIKTNTPTGIPFEFDVDTDQDRIVITTQNSSQHAYMLRSLLDLYLWLKDDCDGNWVLLGAQGEEESPNVGTIEQWARSEQNSVNGFYGLTPGLRGEFASYIPSILEHFGFVEVEHNLRNNRIRARPVTPK